MEKELKEALLLAIKANDDWRVSTRSSTDNSHTWVTNYYSREADLHIDFGDKWSKNNLFGKEKMIVNGYYISTWWFQRKVIIKELEKALARNIFKKALEKSEERIQKVFNNLKKE